MCGIFGVKGEFDRLRCDDILASIRHRGPDGSGVKDFGDCLLAHVRLAIIDPLPEADQPFLSDNGEIGVVFNGEIYNYKELVLRYGLAVKTASDTEVVLRLYERFGERFVELLDGMFAIGIWDNQKKRVLLARDRAGEKPLYYANSAKGFVFGSTTAAIIASGMIDVKIKKQSIWDFFSFLWVPEPNTIFEEMFALMPGNMLILDEGSRPLIKPYKNIFSATFEDGDGVKNFIKESVAKAVVDRLVSDVPIGAFLSGGIDSTLVCAIASRVISNFPTFSVGFRDDVDEYSGYADETKYAVAASRALGTKHTTIMVEADDFLALLDDFVSFSDQPFAVVSGLGILAVAKEAKKHGIKVLLSGDGADEIFGGYGWHVKVRYSDKNAFSADKPKGWHYYATESQKRSFLSRYFFDSCESSTRLLVNEPLNAKPKDFLNHDLEFYLKNEMMTKLDRMTMAYGVEGRAAFVSPVLLDFANKISYEDLLPTKETKYRLKQAFADILPPETLSRQKHGFNPPIDHWIRNDWNELLKNALSKHSVLYRLKIIDDYSVENFWKMFNSGERIGMIGFCFIVLNMWLGAIDKKGYSIYV